MQVHRYWRTVRPRTLLIGAIVDAVLLPGTSQRKFLWIGFRARSFRQGVLGKRVIGGRWRGQGGLGWHIILKEGYFLLEELLQPLIEFEVLLVLGLVGWSQGSILPHELAVHHLKKHLFLLFLVHRNFILCEIRLPWLLCPLLPSAPLFRCYSPSLSFSLRSISIKRLILNFSSLSLQLISRWFRGWFCIVLRYESIKWNEGI